MKRQIRILRLHYYGRIKLAKRIRSRIVIEKAWKAACGINPIWKGLSPKQFAEVVVMLTWKYNKD
jgi:hypothetical protein